MAGGLSSKKERLGRHIERLARFNATPGRGITRFSYTEQDRQARKYLLNAAAELGLQIITDPVGNMRARLEGKDRDAPPVLTGSHIDTVLYGGKYDGVVGVVCGLEALTVFKEQDFKPGRAIELIIFAEEEGANFGSGLAGSKALVGIYSPEDLKKMTNDDGVSMYEAARRFGLDPGTMDRHVLKPGQIHAMVEIHIEQSLVLDTEKIPVGIVTGIAGMKRLKVEIEGQPNHAGATPMRYRKDPMAGAAEVVSTIEETAGSRALPTTVGTVGKIICSPNVVNVIPEKVELFVDTRDVDPAGVETVSRALMDKLEQLAAERGLRYSVTNMGEIEPTLCAETVVEALQESAEKRGIANMRMGSGALHDTAVLAGVTDIGMLFVPSIGGRSHVPEEKTDLQDITKGSDVLMGALQRLSAL
jgi:allantoate deiminase